MLSVSDKHESVYECTRRSTTKIHILGVVGSADELIGQSANNNKIRALATLLNVRLLFST